MKSLSAKSVVFFLVLTTSRCAPGRLGTIDRYNPSFSLTDDDDGLITIATTESAEDNTWEYDDDYFTDATTNEIPLETIAPQIDQLAGQDDTTKGQTAVTDVAGPSTTLAAYTAGE